MRTIVMFIWFHAALWTLFTIFFAFIPFWSVIVFSNTTLIYTSKRMEPTPPLFNFIIESTPKALPIVQTFKILWTKVTLNTFSSLKLILTYHTHITRWEWHRLRMLISSIQLLSRTLPFNLGLSHSSILKGERLIRFLLRWLLWSDS